MEHTPDKKWYVVDASGKPLGRLASRIAQILTGKHKPTYIPHQDQGDFVVVTNAEKVKVTGNKERQKTYYHHTEYPTGLKMISLAELRKKHPERILQLAVKGMLPQNKLRDRRLKKLKIYIGEKHPHQAQNPEPLRD